MFIAKSCLFCYLVALLLYGVVVYCFLCLPLSKRFLISLMGGER